VPGSDDAELLKLRKDALRAQIRKDLATAEYYERKNRRLQQSEIVRPVIQPVNGEKYTLTDMDKKADAEFEDPFAFLNNDNWKFESIALESSLPVKLNHKFLSEKIQQSIAPGNSGRTLRVTGV